MLRDNQAWDERDEVFEKWVQQNLRDLPLSPLNDHADKNMQPLLASLQKERSRHRKRKWTRRFLEGAGGLAAAILLLVSLPQWGGMPQQEFAEQPADTRESAADNPELVEERTGSFSVQGGSDEAEALPPVSSSEESTAESTDPADAASTETHENQAFRVEVPTPLAVGERFTVSGQARVFEATFSYEVEDGHNVLASGYETADQGAPQWGNFTLDVELEMAPTSPNGTLIIYESSAKDGSRVNQLYIPLQFEEEQVAPLDAR